MPVRLRSPLQGRTFLLLREPREARELAARLRRLGARVLLSPAIRTAPIPLDKRGRSFLLNPDAYDGALLTSARGAERLAALRRQVYGTRPPPWPTRTRIYAVGPRTAAAARAARLPVRGTAREYSAEGLAALLSPRARGKRFLFPRALAGRDVLPRALVRAGARVDLWPVYRTVPAPPTLQACRALRAGRVDAVFFTSPSTVRSLLAAFSLAERRRIFEKCRAVSIGPATAAALKDMGVRAVLHSREATTDSMLTTLAKELHRSRP